MTVLNEQAAAPRSWAEDLQTYRTSRGSQSFSTTNSRPQSYGRTCLVPFADTRNSLYPYNDFPDQDGGYKTQQQPDVQTQRYSRHGWGDVSLLKQDGYEGTMHPRGVISSNTGKGKGQAPEATDRNGLFGVLQQTEAGGADSWIGHHLISPGTGKLSIAKPPDPRGRRDLFDVLHARNPGTPSDDSWIGNVLMNPTKGKRNVPGPEQIRGRRDLSDTFTQSILREPNPAALLERGADPLADAWCGNILIDPSKGKRPVHGVAAAGEVMYGAVFKPPHDPHWTDFPKRHSKPVAPSAPDTAADVLQGTAPIPSGPKSTKRILPEPTGQRIVPRKDMYAHMTYRPLSQEETKAYGKSWSDTPHVTGRKVITPPGSQAPGKGPDMLAWRPEQALGQFVPYGKLAQQSRVKH